MLTLPVPVVLDKENKTRRWKSNSDLESGKITAERRAEIPVQLSYRENSSPGGLCEGLDIRGRCNR